ncbi:meiotic recombination [Tulasnella sp. 330]|nr:meiotic recombination [Tulasnella sp. 330]KAG8875147.1 meiotic recombination [Tulasnella sp. 331]KAG8886794.1 meiotic recombination [Tulasnella sp. 332]
MSSPAADDGPPPTALTAARRSDDIIKIMLATDNHIGYMERDPVRGQDAINTFKEILELAVKYDVDFVLLGGDLFHENRPSRDCLYRTSALLREYSLADKPVQVELLSDPDEGKADGCTFPAINYEDPNLNVGIPVFSIHGNHDDPQGAGHEGALCALDLLSVSGLINYIGKVDLPSQDTTSAEPSGIEIKPVLLRKGQTQLALYGIGNVKDQRMHFELRSNRVRMFMPRNKDDWFNILLVHQNRVKHGPQEHVPEGMFDDSINLVVWGHEHDCRIEPEEVPGKPYFITQPGSSVATSLSDGESIQKKVAFLEIQGKEFQMTPIPLRTVRPFVMEEIVLSEVAEEENLSLGDKMEINKYLRSRVEALIARAGEEWEQRNQEAIAAGDEPLQPMLPLVRIKVDTTGVSEMSNPIRFGQEFQGRVANPKELLVFQRAKKQSKRAVQADQPALSIDDPDLSVQQKLERVRVAQLVEEYLGAQELQLLGEHGMSDAVQVFVDKEDSTAIKTYFQKSLSTILTDVAVREVEEDDVQDALVAAKEVADKEFKTKADKRAKAKEKAKAKEQVKEDAKEVDSMEEDDGPIAPRKDSNNMLSEEDEAEEEEPVPVPKKKAAAKPRKAAPAKAPAKKAPAKSKKLFASDSEVEDVADDVEEDEEEEAPKPVKKTGRAAVLDSIAKGPAKKKAAPKAISGRGTSSRTAAKAATSKMQAIEISDDD